LTCLGYQRQGLTSLDTWTGVLYNTLVRSTHGQIGAGARLSDTRAKVTVLNDVNAEHPIEGWIAHAPEPTPLDSDMHHTFEAGILLSGQQERHFEGLVRVVEAGDAWLSAAWEPHGWRTTVGPTDELVMHFVPELLGDAELEGLSWLSFFAAPPEERPTARGAEGRQRVLTLGNELVEEFKEHGWAWREMARAGLVRLLVMMGREWTPRRQNWRWSASPTGKLARIMPAVELVHGDLAERVHLSAAAKACGFSASWFRTLFWRTMGITYSRFERRARLAHATRLLLGTDEPVDAVGEQTGFADGSHFHRAFHRHYGCTPTEFRTRGRQTAPAPASAARR